MSKVLYHDALTGVRMRLYIRRTVYLQNGNGPLRLQIISKPAGESPFILIEMGQLMDVLKKINLLPPED